MVDSVSAYNCIINNRPPTLHISAYKAMTGFLYQYMNYAKPIFVMEGKLATFLPYLNSLNSTFTSILDSMG